MSADDELEDLDGATPTALEDDDDEHEAKPVLWIGLTETGRSLADEGHLDRLGARVREAVGDDYHVVAADDTVRLADEADLEDLRSEVARLRRQLRDSDDDG
jgi:hypothetical protein